MIKFNIEPWYLNYNLFFKEIPSSSGVIFKPRKHIEGLEYYGCKVSMGSIWEVVNLSTRNLEMLK